MNRYTQTVYRPTTVVRWDLIAQDIRSTIACPITRALAAVRRKIAPIARRAAVASMAVSVGIAIGVSSAIQTYQLLRLHLATEQKTTLRLKA